MPAFHCPMGSAFYDDEPCIDCGLCSARTSEEMVAASKKLRDYLRSHVETDRLSKKIALCGKGGAGKSTVVALMANVLRRAGYLVFVIDSDESNPGLYRMFGFDRPATPLAAVLNGFSRDEPSPETAWLRQERLYLEGIPRDFVLGAPRLKLVTAGKIIEPFQGCACGTADLIRDFVQRIVLKDKEIVLADMEAGIESFGRGVERGVDTVLIVVEPSFESLDLAERISYMADGIGVGRVRAILNKVPSPEIERTMLEGLKKRKIQSIGTIWLDPRISQAGLEGGALPENATAETQMAEITRALLAQPAAEGTSRDASAPTD